MTPSSPSHKTTGATEGEIDVLLSPIRSASNVIYNLKQRQLTNDDKASLEELSPKLDAAIRDVAARLRATGPSPTTVTREELDALLKENIELYTDGFDNFQIKGWQKTVDAIMARIAHPPSPAPGAGGVTKAAQDVLAERARQISTEKRTRQHDDDLVQGTLARAAAVYAAGSGLFQIDRLQVPRQVWPYKWEYKPKDTRRDLVRAGALILAEIERHDRVLAMKPLSPSTGLDGVGVDIGNGPQGPQEGAAK